MPAGMPSLVTTPGVTHTTTVAEPPTGDDDICMAGTVFQEVCADGNWRFIRVPCDKWTCDLCRKRKLFGGLVPELVRALTEARRQRLTLKMLTVCWQDGTLGAQPTSQGSKRRGLDEQHLIQWLKRQGYLPKKGEVFYMRVAERHWSGKIHLHIFIICPFVPHAELKEAWRTITGGSYIIDLQAVYLKCPDCWVKGQTRKEKKRRSIVPWPGSGECSQCGYKVTEEGALKTVIEETDTGITHRRERSAADFKALARGIAIEAGKYLAKDGTEGVKKKLTCSGSVKHYCSQCDGFMKRPEKKSDLFFCPSCQKLDADPVARATGWQRFRQRAPAGKGFCDGCEDEHAYAFVGKESELLGNYPELETVFAFDGGRGMGWVPPGGEPCLCWGPELEWRLSKFTAARGLGDLVPRARNIPARAGISGT